MRTIEEIRHARLLQLLEQPEFDSLQAFANAINRRGSQVSQWKNRSKRKRGGISNIDSESARNIERQMNLPHGWMDNDPAHDEAAVLSTGMTVAGWLDNKLTDDKRYRAFFHIYQMIIADEWPAAGSSTHGPPIQAFCRPLDAHDERRDSRDDMTGDRKR